MQVPVTAATVFGKVAPLWRRVKISRLPFKMPRVFWLDHPDVEALRVVWRDPRSLEECKKSEKVALLCAGGHVYNQRIEGWLRGSRRCKTCTNLLYKVRAKTNIVDGKKTCTKCHITYDISEFAVSSSRRRNHCKKCIAAYARVVTKRPKNLVAARIRARKKRLGKIGVTPELLEELAQAQDYRCRICMLHKPLVADHNHATGKFRALLCSNCNVSIGLIYENPDTAIRIAEYLRLMKGI